MLFVAVHDIHPHPFWALPIVSIGGVSVREMMGYCLLALLIAFPLFGLALLVS